MHRGPPGTGPPGTVTRRGGRDAPQGSPPWGGVDLREIFDALGDAMLLHDRDGRVVDANRQACKVLGYEKEELLGRAVADVDPTIGAARWAELRTRAASGPVTIESVHRRKDGSTLQVEVRLGPVPSAGGELMLLTARNVTERRAREETRQQIQKLDAIGRLAGGIAHDFNNVLTAIMGHASLLEPELGERPDLLDEVREIQQAAQRAASLTRHLLAFGRRQVLQPRVVDPAEVVHGLTALFQRLLGDDVELEVDVPAGAAAVRVDPEKLEQALLNLAANAREAMPEGGRFTVTLRYADIGELEAWRMPFPFQPGRYALLSLSDTGRGIPDAVRGHIFEPFFSTKSGGRGSGLGLSMVYGFLKQSGGYVWVESRESEGGATFYVALPLVDSVPPAVSSSGLAPAPGGRESRPPTVLVAEDEPAILSLLRRALGELGWRVLTARDGLEAVEALDRHADQVDLLVTDVVMPRLGGLEVARSARERVRGLPVLLMSGFSLDLVRQAEEIGGRVRLLEKPFTAADVTRTVAEMLGGGET